MSEAPPLVQGGPPPLASHPPDALAAGARLAEFEIRGVLGAGGFGIVYLAWDHALEREVALKEYMPVTLAGRSPDQRVTLRAAAHQETFALGLRSFVNEARLLARFDHPSLVKVYRFWEANGTAYMAMPMYHGPTLRQVRQQQAPGSPGEAWCRALLEPLLGALQVLHREGVYHRDIAPDNIVLPEPGKPVLLDFGAARRVIGDRTHALTAILKPHFAPIEQYADVASMRQGPWTDLYGLAATFYYLLTGHPPLPAAARALHDELPPLARLQPAGCSAAFLEALDWAMAVRPQQRPQDVAAWREVLDGRAPVPPMPPAPPLPAGTAGPHAAMDGVSAPSGGAAGFDPTLPLRTTGPRPPGSMPATGPLWRGFTVPGGVQTLQAAPPPGARDAAAEDGLSPLPVVGRRRPRAVWMGALALVVIGGAAALAWHAAPSTQAGPREVSVAQAPEARSAGTHPDTAKESTMGPVAAPSPAPAAAPVAQAAPAPAAAGVTPAQTNIVPPPLTPSALPQQPPPPTAQASQPQRPPAGAGTRSRSHNRDRERGSARTAANVPGPAERCADRLLLGRLICMKRACDTDPRLRHHPECVRMQEAEQERRERILQR
jgi:hypothetical protein